MQLISLKTHLYSCLLSLITEYVNDKGGREAGDALLKVFGKVLKRAASSYGFVGYNGSDQFIGMFEECTVQRAEDFKQYLKNLCIIIMYRCLTLQCK